MKFKSNQSQAPLNFLVVSAGGMGNIGDDIVGLVAAQVCKSQYQGNIRYAGPPYQRTDVEWADVVVIGGGGLFYDWSTENVDNYLNFIEYAKYMGKKTVALGVGTQGITTNYGKRRYSEVLNNLTDLITVRDEKDAIVLSDDVGVTKPVHVAHDLAFLLPQYYGELSRNISNHAKEQLTLVRDLKSQGRPLVGVSIAAYMWTGEFLDGLSPSEKKIRQEAYQACVEHTQKLAATHEVLLLLHSKDDLEFYQEIQQGHDHITLIDFSNDRNDAVAMLDVYQQLDVAMVSRYHGLILALLAHKPVAILGTQEKIVKSVNSTLPEFSDYLFTQSQITELFNACLELEGRPLTSVQIDNINNSIIKANKNIEFMYSLLYSFKM
jgi:polysaccharide pyruvyl transferase WcaK-like protein